MADSKYNHIYGPVPSRRLGLSLGIDLVPFKTCSYNCIYCQIGRNPKTTLQRREYVSMADILREVQEWLATGGTCDYLTLTGSGEPTLHSGLADIITELKSFSSIPIAVITNGSLLHDPQVREDLMGADLVVPSLDAGSQEVFEKINRPQAGLSFAGMLNGLIEFAAVFPGKLWLEVLLVKNVNTSDQDLKDLKGAIDRIKPDKVQINTTIRPPAEETARKAEDAILVSAREIFGPAAEIVVPYIERGVASREGSISASKVMELLRRRPCTADDIAESFVADPAAVEEVLQSLLEMEAIIRKTKAGKVYYTPVDQDTVDES